ncbi:iron-sulfur cluster biosynthesis family protein [Aquibacillus halophilus]|uniref:iron-sulfur cluster biosynthesis family protein n=1 Tax=Aquibacillus halophilus TaxID=930132 RepID=UPI0014787D57|nr:iron-sulfur cluster biosynthesis family protein [Aquibacillus halophilus]
MRLSITPQALERVIELQGSDQNYLWLYYDTEGCGCGVSGLPSVRFATSKNDSYQLVESNKLQVIIHKQQAVFFAKEMKLDYTENFFRLSSSEGMLNPIISEFDLQKEEVV